MRTSLLSLQLFYGTRTSNLKKDSVIKDKIQPNVDKLAKALGDQDHLIDYLTGPTSV